MRFMYLNWCRPQSKQFVSRSFRVSVHVYEDVHSICVYTISSFAITWQLRQINKMFCFTRYLIPEICLVIWTQRITEHLQIIFDVVPYLSQKSFPTELSMSIDLMLKRWNMIIFKPIDLPLHWHGHGSQAHFASSEKSDGSQSRSWHILFWDGLCWLWCPMGGRMVVCEGHWSTKKKISI